MLTLITKTTQGALVLSRLLFPGQLLCVYVRTYCGVVERVRADDPTSPLSHVQTGGYKSGGRGRRTLFSLAPSCPFALAPLFATDALQHPLLRAELLLCSSSFFFLRLCRYHRAPGWARMSPPRTSPSSGRRGACHGRRTLASACRVVSRGLRLRDRSAWSSSRILSAGLGCR